MTAIAPQTHGSRAPSQGGCRVLVVDDEQAMQVLASTVLQRLGHEAITVESGERGIEAYREALHARRPFSLVVMDLALPGGISGLEATYAIKQIDRHACIIVSSGYLEQNARNAAHQHGFAGILPKPYTTERMSSELRFVLKQREPAAVLETPVERHAMPPHGFGR